MENRLTQKELNEIIRKHELWLKHATGGERAVLFNVTISGLNLSEANLAEAEISAKFLKTKFTNTNFCNADLKYSEFEECSFDKCTFDSADLRSGEFEECTFNDNVFNSANLNYVKINKSTFDDVSFQHSNLFSCFFYHCCITSSIFAFAKISHSRFDNTNIYNTLFHHADLLQSIITDSDLLKVDFRYSNCAGVDFCNSHMKKVSTNELTSFFQLQCPEEGSFIGYKVANKHIIKLLITEDAKRSSATSRKCRCSKAKVLSIENLSTGVESNQIVSDFDDKFIYEVGKIVEVEDFDMNRWKECSTGIHFFITRQEAIDYFKRYSN